MSQFGMHMPGARAKRAATMDVFTGLLFAAFVALAVACGFVWQAASKVGHEGSAFGLQPESRAGQPGIKLK